jgi:hypothetical protein
MNKGIPRSPWRLGAVLALGIAMSIAVWACSTDSPDTSTAPEIQKPSVVQYGFGNPDVARVMRVQDMATPDLMARSSVVGTATGLNAAGELAIKVYTEELIPSGKLPSSIDGIPVEQVVTGKLVAFKGPPPMDGGGSGDDPQAPQTAPIKLGTSGGWRHDLANGYCCGGTLGGLIQNGSGTKYVLSNWHVLYADIVDGGNGRTADPGDPVIQPGLIDVGCNAGGAIDVATLVAGGGSLPGANVDAGIAAVIPGQVDESGEILSIGVPSSSTVAAFVGQAVKKMGRTTGLGRAAVDGLNASVSITYSNECAGGTAFTKTYSGQIVTTNNRCGFLAGGDSGSVMFEDVDTNPRAVGLLYAGSVTCNKFAVAIANPIDEVLDHYGSNFHMVGN